MNGTTARWIVGTAVLPLCLAACGDGAVPEDALSLVEAESLFTGVMEMHRASVGLGDTVTIGCLGGGDWQLVRNRARWSSGDTTEVSVTFEVTPRACLVRSGGLRFTVDGDPNVTLVLVWTQVDFDLTDLAGIVAGSVAWQLGPRDGACAMDLVLEVEVGNFDPGAPLEGVLSGSLCGHDVVLDASSVL